MGNLDDLFAENESLRGSCKAMGVDMGKLTRERNSFRAKTEKLKAENEALRKFIIGLAEGDAQIAYAYADLVAELSHE